MRHFTIAAALLITACAPAARDYELPAWIELAPGVDAKPARLQGEWRLNKSLSDDPERMIARAMASLRKNQGAFVAGGGGRNAAPPGVGAGPSVRRQPDPYQDAAASDPRLAALRAESVSIEQDADAIRFTFNDAASVSYSIGQAISADQNINLSFADWEGSQFVVEKNGPDGLALERWTLSPDGSQLYLAVSMEIKLPDFPLPQEPLLIGRMFDKVRE